MTDKYGYPSIVLGLMTGLVLLLPVVGPPSIAEAQDPDSSQDASDQEGQTFPPEDRIDPPPSDLKPSEVPDKLKEHDYVYKVDYVLDGDSIRLENEKELRLIGVDAPEKGQRFADAARSAVRSLIPERAIVAVDLDRKWWDRYGRLLGYVYTIKRVPDQKPQKVLINERLVKRGLAQTYFHQKNTAFIERLIEAQRTAIRKERRLFAQIEESADQYLRVKNHFRFHRPNCKYVRDIPDKYLIKYPVKREALWDGCSSASCCQP
jgi:endonuclease YncB( thermonuclease family)